MTSSNKPDNTMTSLNKPDSTMTSLNKPGNEEILTRIVCMAQVTVMCGIGGSCLAWTSQCMEDVRCGRVKNTGMFVICLGVLQLIQLVCTCVTMNTHKLKYMFATYVLWSGWVLAIFILHWIRIRDTTQSWTELVIISAILMTLYGILTIEQCVIFVRLIKLPDIKTIDSLEKYVILVGK